MMKRYFARYFMATPNCISGRYKIERGNSQGWKFNLSDAEISLIDDKKGLWADCFLFAKNLGHAEEKSKVLIEYILGLIDFTTSSYSSSSFVSSYEASPDIKMRIYKQVFHIPTQERNIAVINEKVFQEIFHKRIEKRILRGISWLRKGYLEQEYVDKFIAFWTGLESISELLCDFFEISTEDRKRICNKCGNTIDKRISSLGTKTLFLKEIENNRTLFRRIRGARGKLLHGGGPLNEEFVDEIRTYNPLIRKALITGIGKLLEISDETVKSVIQRKTNPYSDRVKIIIKTNLVDFNPPGIEYFTKQPRLDMESNKLLKREVNNQGKLSITKDLKIKTNVNIRGITLEAWRPDGTSITSFEITSLKISAKNKIIDFCNVKL